MFRASDVIFMYDTDALVQVFIADQHNILRVLRDDFGVRSFIMSEVEVELRSKPKFAGRIRPLLDKSLKAGWLKILSAGDLEELGLARGVTITLADIRQRGAEYSVIVQTGEAYTHAAAVLLDTVAVSNDANAIKVMEANGKALPPTILRSFDLFGFYYTEKYISEKDAELIRTVLRTNLEWIPLSMKNSSFSDGLLSMRCRLSTSLSIASSGGHWQEPFFLKRII